MSNKKKLNEEEIIELTESDLDGGLIANLMQNIIGSMETRCIYLYGFINEQNIMSAINQIHTLETTDDSDINLYINSDGGFLNDCFALIDVMDTSPCDVATYTVGRAASAACLIASNGTKGKRFCGKNAQFMYHEPYGDLYDVKGSDVPYYDKMFRKDNQRANKILSQNTGQNVKDIKEMFFQPRLDKWMGAREALKFGIVDKIMKKRKVTIYKD